MCIRDSGSVDEPISHPQFFEIIEHFSSWDSHINIATNGSLRTTSWWEKLAKALPKSHRVTWGIDGSDELSEVYREGSNFKKVRDNWRAFISAGGRANWQFIVFQHNEHQLETAKQISEELEISEQIFLVNFIQHKWWGETKNQKILNKHGIIILHRHKNEQDPLPSSYKLIEQKVYGISKKFLCVFGLIIERIQENSFFLIVFFVW